MGTGVELSAGQWMQVAGSVSSAAGAHGKASAEGDAYAYQAGIAGMNAGVADEQARDAVRRGVVAEGTHRLRTSQLKSTQRTALAARNIDITTGSAAETLRTTDTVGEIDALTIRANAAREAWGYQVGASNYRGNAELYGSAASAVSPASKAASTLLTDAGRVAPGWYATRDNWLLKSGGGTQRYDYVPDALPQE